MQFMFMLRQETVDETTKFSLIYRTWLVNMAIDPGSN